MEVLYLGLLYERWLSRKRSCFTGEDTADFTAPPHLDASTAIDVSLEHSESGTRGKGLYLCLVGLDFDLRVGACLPTWPSYLERQNPLFHLPLWRCPVHTWHSLDVDTMETLSARIEKHRRDIRRTCAIRRATLPTFLLHIIPFQFIFFNQQRAFQAKLLQNKICIIHEPNTR